jgi:tRNA-dihydrouridine synthase B
VMIGRAAVGAPWLVGALARALDDGGPAPEPSRVERREAALEHLDWLVGKLGQRAGLRHARKHLAAYADQAGTNATLRRELVTGEDAVQVRRLLGDAFEDDGARQAA